MKKKIFSFMLISVAVLGAATAPIVAADNVAAGDNAPAVETVTQPQAQTQKFNINYWALRAGGGATPLGTETVEVSPGEAHTVEQKEFPGHEFQGASIDNGATGTDVELPYTLKYGDKNQGIDLIYKKKSQKPADPQKPAEPEKPGQPEKPADPQKPAEPEKPADPQKPAEQEKPANPEKPAEAKLPDTGTRDNFASFITAIVAFITGVILLRKKNN